MRSGGLRGLQSRRGAPEGVLAGFDSQALPPIFSARANPRAPLTADLAAYAAAIAEGQEILSGLGSDAVIRVWQSRFAGEQAGTVVASIEWPSMSAMAEDDELMASSPEMAEWLAGLGELRTIVADSLYQEITQ